MCLVHKKSSKKKGPRLRFSFLMGTEKKKSVYPLFFLTSIITVLHRLLAFYIVIDLEKNRRMDERVSDIPPADFEAIFSALASAEKEPGNSEKHSEVLIKCMKYIPKNCPPRHFFCDKYMYPISAHYLIVFSFPGVKNDEISHINELLIQSLQSCENCINRFNYAIAKLREKFLIERQLDRGSFESFVNLIYSWQALRIKLTLQSCVEKFDLAYSLTDIDRNAIKECIIGPSILRNDPLVRELLKKVIAKFPDDQSLLPNRLYAGLLFFQIEGDSLEKDWSDKCMKHLEETNFHFDGETLDEVVRDEFNLYFYKVQNAKTFTESLCIKFWNTLTKFLAFLDKSAFLKLNEPKDIEVMRKLEEINFFNLIRVLYNNLMAIQDKPLPSLLSAFDAILKTVGIDFWRNSSAVPFPGFLDPILLNPNFSKYLLDPSNYELSVFLDWTLLFVGSLTSSQRQTAAVRISTFLMRISQKREADNGSINETSQLNQKSCHLLLQCFDIDMNKVNFAEPNFAVNILKRRDVRAAVDSQAPLVVSMAIQQLKNLTLEESENTEPSNALHLITSSVEYDIISLAHNSSILKQLGNEIPSSFDAFPLLWEELAKLQLYIYPQLTKELVKSMRNTSNIIKFSQKKNNTQVKEKSDAIARHNGNVTLILKLLGNVLDKVEQADSYVLKSIFNDKDIAISYCSCLFSPSVNQAALNISYQAFDAAGRLEAIGGLLKLNLESSLNAINKNLRILTNLAVFEPCPKTIRILMDVVRALTNPLEGIATIRSSELCKPEIRGLWEESWHFLMMVYEKTLLWASHYHLEELIEFTRDTLELSHSLLDSFMIILNALSDENNNNTSYSLLGVFMKAFHYVIVWLRLGDTSLLNLCLTLVFKGLELAKDLNFTVDIKFIDSFARFGARSKKFKNKLNDQQRADILAKASEIDGPLVDQILAENRKTKASKSSVMDSVQVDQQAAYKYQTHQKPTKQQTLSRFGVVTKEPPVAPPPAEKGYKSANLEAIRKELKSNRAPSVKPGPTVAPAAPRPAGFNSKAPAVGRSLNITKRKRRDSESSEEGDDDNIDFSDLFVDKKKKAKVVEVDINGKIIDRSAQTKKIDEERKREERMRLRLNVSLKPLYSTILKWNYNSTSDYPGDDRDIYKKTKETYEDCKDYIKTTEPLLMLECWQGIQSAKRTQQELPFELLIGGRTSCDGFFDVYASIKKQDLNDRKIGDSDLLVLGHAESTDFSSAKAAADFLKSPGAQTCLAKVRDIKSASADHCDIVLRVFPQGPMMGILTPKSIVLSMRVTQMVTTEREYSSLKGLEFYDLSEEIIKGKPADHLEIGDDEANRIVDIHKVNKSQAKAIIGSFVNEGFSLIQGPPGTGKTKTILGIVGYTLSQTKANLINVPKSIELSKSPSPESNQGPKVLICAPSNAAVDELVLRLKDGVNDSKGERFSPKVVRLGRSDAINAAVRDLTLEELIDKHLQAQSKQAVIDPSIRTEHTKCISLRDQLRDRLNRPNLSSNEIVELETQLREVTKQRNELGKKLDEQRENASIAFRTREIEKRQLQAKILSSAQIICSTLSGSAHDFLASLSMNFDQVIIDEACQCVELSAIIPLRYGSKRCVMVGDPNQLPPTVLSQAAAGLNYEQSLFVRMQKNHPDSVYLLDVQYRMHPDISKFPSQAFYESRLQDGKNMLEKNDRPWHKQFPLSPYRFFDIVGAHQQHELTRSLFNYLEARVALEIVEKLMIVLPEDQFKGRIGIISPYKEQIRVLKDVFRKKYGIGILNEIDFNTVDGFQGQEKEIIIMSCVRASESGNVGFLSDVRRMNVALTRARTSLWILGNKSSLSRNKVWAKLLADAHSRNAITSASPGFLARISSSNVSKNIPTQAAVQNSVSDNTISDSSVSVLRKESNVSNGNQQNQKDDKIPNNYNNNQHTNHNYKRQGNFTGHGQSGNNKQAGHGKPTQPKDKNVHKSNTVGGPSLKRSSLFESPTVKKKSVSKPAIAISSAKSPPLPPSKSPPLPPPRSPPPEQLLSHTENKGTSQTSSKYESTQRNHQKREYFGNDFQSKSNSYQKLESAKNNDNYHDNNSNHTDHKHSQAKKLVSFAEDDSGPKIKPSKSGVIEKPASIFIPQKRKKNR